MKRPMFRKGGSAGEGITSGLAPRQGYNTNENNTVKQNDLSKVDLRNMDMQQIKNLADRMSFQAPPMAPDNSLRDFKIDFGLDLVSRTPGGNIFQTAGAAAKDPFARFKESRAAYNKGVQDRAITKYNSQTGMFDTLLGAQAKILGSDGGSKMFAKQANDAEIQSIMGELFQLQTIQSDPDTALDENEFNQQQAILMQRLQGYTGKNPAVQSLFGNKEQADIVIAGIQQDITNSEKEITIINAQGEEEIVIEGEYAAENPKYVGEETARRYIALYNQMIKDSIGLPESKAEGGRIGYSAGNMVEDQITEVSETETMPQGGGADMASDNLSYDELRARLPKEISDDIVSILAESPQALIMFSEIQTQTDVDEFNMTYGVNLSLPSGA
jgi:hypothetical protein|tara:strand:- start:1335 stop:2492 length:1158 start_codon:yes stop_codon:yes gene_type:complete